MEECSRILIEEYCENHDTAKSRRLKKLVDMSYDYIMHIAVLAGQQGRNVRPVRVIIGGQQAA